VRGSDVPGMGEHHAGKQGTSEQGAGERGPDRYGERAETYLRLLAEAALRPKEDLRADRARADRVERAARTLVDAGVLDGQAAGQILTELQLALLVRRRPTVPAAATRLRGLAGFQPSRPRAASGRSPRPWRVFAAGPATAGSRPWRVFPAGPATAGSRAMALILIADRALAPATLYFPPAVGLEESDLPSLARLTASDDLGTRYRLGYANGSWAANTWTGTIIVYPAPPGAARWLKINSPNEQVLRVDMTGAPAALAAHGTVSEPVAESPGERLLARQAEAMLTALSLGHPTGHGPSELAETVATLEGAGVLSPLSLAPKRLAALGQLLGLPTQGPADQVPARWTEILARYGRRRQPPPVSGTAAIGVALPEIDAARFAIAGLHSGASGTFLHILVQGLRPITRRHPPGLPDDSGFSWWARDDAGGWHLGAVEDISPVGGPEGLLRLALLPPLGHPTGTLTIQVSGHTQQATANLPVRW
jgi:hypothetical protein